MRKQEMIAEDNFGVWETRALKRAGEGEAKQILERIAKQVQPIMREHKWRVKILSEMHSKKVLGTNLGAGIHIRLQLRKLRNDHEFIPFDQVLDTMLHELSHNSIAPHNAQFYKLWNKLREECDELRFKGITSLEGFDCRGKRLGGIFPQPPLSSLSQTALVAAEKRARLQPLLPSGPNRLGGDRLVMLDLSPIQAAAMAAERRLHGDIWCASQLYSAIGESSSNISKDLEDMGQQSKGRLNVFYGPSENGSDTLSRKRSRESDNGLETNSVDLDADTSTSKPILNHDAGTHKRCKLFRTSVSQPNFRRGSVFVESSGASSSVSMNLCDATHGPEEPGVWGCGACTFLNHPLIPMCEVCSTPRRC